MNKRTVKNFKTNSPSRESISEDMILAEMICNNKDTKVFPWKEIVNEDIDALIFGEIDIDGFYHSEK